MNRPALDPRDCLGCGRTFQPIAITNGLCGPCRGERREGFLAARNAQARGDAGQEIAQPDRAPVTVCLS